MKRCFGIFILMFVISGQASALVETSTLRDFIKRKEAGKLTKYEQICVEDGYGCMPFPDLKNIELFKKITYYPNADVYCQDGSSSFYVPKKFFSTKETKKARAFCKAFSSNNIHDNKSKTAWCEGVEGNGVGEVLIVGRLPTGTTGGERLKVWNGYGKSEKVFESNNRIKDLTLIIYLTMDHSNGDAWTNLYPIKMKKFKLKDLNGYQEIKVPKFRQVHKEIGAGEYEYTFVSNRKGQPKVKESSNWRPHYSVGLRIDSVYSGKKYDDTCVSEFKVAESASNN